MNSQSSGPDYLPTASWDTLRLRAALLRRVRTFFDARGFLEVETPVLSADTVVDRHLDPIGVLLPDDPRQPQQGRSMWLQTSPEFAMKRLLAAGGQAIYQITHAFRLGERGRLHNPEFTMLEWYRVGDSYEQGMQLLADLACEMLEVREVERLSYREAFLRHVGLDPHRASVDELKAVAQQRQLPPLPDASGDDREAWRDLLLVECVEPNFDAQKPTLLYDYPADHAALAKLRPGPPAVAERFELYYRGLELANGYHELTDPAVLEQRNTAISQLRAADGKYPLPEHSRLIEAMRAGLPESCGVALGFDRLVMAICGARRIDEVIAFPIERA